MQIVINISDEMYHKIKNNYIIIGGRGNGKTITYTLFNALVMGIPLPKGHGQLKDVDKIGLTGFECLLCNGDYKEALKMLDEKIKNAQTIIEKDDN